ncbi:hypothetical protein G6N74_28500 [Mesorhizobium sp. CGMCC 1.15528]|uniref:Uncharacterized protein n=1 Tax=Mesorhizobium zhangyense TaxID=1776730 RepID=A0A7C9RBH8_9HYPH|nr:hypothetical protein [Mesorhizobium zhangyense]NGN45001.1 hypothetical protein [Mesorhizobium zhangyense]
MYAVWTLIGGFRGILVAVAVLASAWAYNKAVDNPIVVAQARAGFVLTAERDALAARLNEEQRQRKASDAALSMLRNELDKQQESELAASERLELEIADYEKKLADAGRSCRLDDSDTDWLRDDKS